MTIIVSNASEVKRLGRKIRANSFGPQLLSELVTNNEVLVAIYRKGFRHTAEVIPDRVTYDLVKGRTVFGEIRGLTFYATTIGLDVYRYAGIENIMAAPARAVA